MCQRVLYLVLLVILHRSWELRRTTNTLAAWRNPKPSTCAREDGPDRWRRQHLGRHITDGRCDEGSVDGDDTGAGGQGQLSFSVRVEELAQDVLERSNRNTEAEMPLEQKRPKQVSCGLDVVL